jgi:hypothetical protein
MADPKKQEYYRAKRDQRLAYQRDYYNRNKSRIIRKREVDAVIDPEKHEAKCVYNRNYYLANRERIVESRKRKRVAATASTVQDADSGISLG